MISGQSNFGHSVIDTLKPSALVLEALSKHIQRNDEGVDEPTLKKWKSEFIKIAEEFDNLLSTVETTRKVLDSQEYRDLKTRLTTENEPNEESTSSAAAESKPDTEETLKNYIHQQTNQSSRKTKAPSEISNKVKQVFRIGRRDYDLEIVETDDSDAKYICPFSQKFYTKPMKHANCIHRVDSVSLNFMCERGAIAKCPIGGCPGRWDKSKAVIDNDFMAEMNRYLRIKEAQKASETANTLSQVHELEDEYTEV